MEGEFFETPCQAFETVPKIIPVDSPVTPEVTQAPPRMASLKDAQAAVEEDGSAIWGQLPDLPFKFDKTGLGFTIKNQKMIRRERTGQLPFRISQSGIHVIEDDDNDFDISKWIFPTPDSGLSNWKTEDVIPISFRQEITPNLVDNSYAIAKYDFDNPIYQAEDESEEDCEVPG